MAKPSSKDRLLDAAEELFAARGFGGVGLAEVAERAGLGKASLFHHFSSKAQLYCAVMVRVLSSLEDQLLRALAEGGSPSVRLGRLSDAAIEALASNPAYPRLLLRVLLEESELPPGLTEAKEAEEIVRAMGLSVLRLLHEGMDSGEFRRANSGHVLLSMIGAIVHPLATGRFGEELIGGPLSDPEQLAVRKKEVRELLAYGIIDRHI